jgi:hypothetical protein
MPRINVQDVPDDEQSNGLSPEEHARMVRATLGHDPEPAHSDDAVVGVLDAARRELKHRESHGGRLSPEGLEAVRDEQAKMSPAALMRYRESHGGMTPAEWEARR